MDEYLPMSYAGSCINGVQFERVLVERICLNYAVEEHYLSPKSSVDADVVNWLFFVGIYESKGNFYLWLEANDHCGCVDALYYDGIGPNTGLVLLTEECAFNLATRISDLGKEYFALKIPVFQELMNTLVSTMECRVRPTTLLNTLGYYSRKCNEIVIANNTSQISMFLALVHEYVHFILRSDRIPPRSIEEYCSDREEYICNSIARVFAEIYFGSEFISSICESLMQKVKNVSRDETATSEFTMFRRDPLPVFTPEETFFFDYFASRALVKPDESLEDYIDSIIDSMIDSMNDRFEKNNADSTIDFRQTGLVLLSAADNNILYDMILNEISPMLPADNWDEKVQMCCGNLERKTNLQC